MKILILGAAFDPPHSGHALMAIEAIRRGIADQVILMPCGNHAFNKTMSPASDRYQMTVLLISELVGEAGSHFVVSDLEIKRAGVSYAFDTLNEVQRQYPKDEVGWLLGSDQLPQFSKWHKYKEILKKYPVYVYPRAGYSNEPLLLGMKKIVGVPECEFSSTEVRDTLRAGGEITTMVGSAVAKYIEEKKLWNK